MYDIPEDYEHETPLQFRDTTDVDKCIEDIRNLTDGEISIIGRESYGSGDGWNEIKATRVGHVRLKDFPSVVVWALSRRTNIHPEWTDDRYLSTNLSLSCRKWYLVEDEAHLRMSRAKHRMTESLLSSCPQLSRKDAWDAAVAAVEAGMAK